MTIKAYSIDEIVEERILDEKQESNIQELFKFLIGDQRSHLSVKCILPPAKQNNASVLFEFKNHRPKDNFDFKKIR